MCEQESFLVVDIDWESEELFFDDEQSKEARRRQATAECGKPITRWDVKTGQLKWVRSRRCKNYDICPRCAEWKKQQELKLLNKAREGGNSKFLEIPLEDRAKFIRQYGKENVRIIPGDDGKCYCAVNTEDEIGEPLTLEHCRMMAKFAVPADNKRISGKLGTKTPKEQEEDNIFAATVEYREMVIDFGEEEKEQGPKSLRELEAVVTNEVDIDHSPQTEDELQWAIYCLEEKTREVCERYELSFYFLVKKQIQVELSEVYWSWAEKKE